MCEKEGAVSKLGFISGLIVTRSTGRCDFPYLRVRFPRPFVRNCYYRQLENSGKFW